MSAEQELFLKAFFCIFGKRKLHVNITATKLELAKLLLNTTDEGIINHIKAVFSTQSQNWWGELPEEIKRSVEKGLSQSKKGQTISHDLVVKSKNVPKNE